MENKIFFHDQTGTAMGNRIKPPTITLYEVSAAGPELLLFARLVLDSSDFSLC